MVSKIFFNFLLYFLNFIKFALYAKINPLFWEFKKFCDFTHTILLSFDYTSPIKKNSVLITESK